MSRDRLSGNETKMLRIVLKGSKMILPITAQPVFESKPFDWNGLIRIGGVQKGKILDSM
jgi:hypothetical protein